MLSFLIINDGPSLSKSFRPNEDSKQWWSRRDAMTRIISNSCLINKGIHNGVTQNAFLLFHNGNEEKEDDLISIAAINCKELAKTMDFITEFEFINALRNNFAECERKNHFDYDIFSSTGISCCHHPWKGISQLPLISNQSALTSNLNTSTMSKKEMVKSILANGNIEFLRKHSMNLSEILILKKLNKTQIEAAYNDMIQFNIEMKSESPQSTIDIPESNSMDEQRLIETFIVLYSKILGNPSRKRKIEELNNQSQTSLIILLLHEDYPQELPIFGSEHVSPSSNNQKVLCVLGGVRDLTEKEIKAMFIAGKYFPEIRFVGANLGRTAEFTSKIIAAIVAHEIARTLPNVLNHLRTLDDWNLVKLPSIRSHNITWNGYKSSKTDLSLKPIEQSKKDIQNISNHNQSVQYLYYIVKFNFGIDEIYLSIDQRVKFFPLIQTIVFALWKSRMVSEQEELENLDDHQSETVENRLFLLFSGGNLICLNKQIISEEVKKIHSGAPSEYQILYILKQLLSILPIHHFDSALSENALIEKVIHFVLSFHQDSFPDKSTRPIFYCPNITIDPSLLHSSNTNSLADKLYSHSCACSVDLLSANNKNNLIISFFGCSSFLGKINQNPFLRGYYSFKYDNNFSTKSFEKKISKWSDRFISLPVFSNEVIALKPIAPHMVIIWLQHWAYHGVLFHVLE